jgi:peptidoglycan-N-acetylglucosamine deacetylase
MQNAGKWIIGLILGLGALAAGPAAGGGPQVEACATNPGLLGLGRVVEIDTAGGPVFGPSHPANDFLRDHEVVLTFDDGPLRPYTRPVLKALADHCTKATFFMVGRMAASDPAMVKEVSAQGHTIGSHTWSHQNLKAIGLLKGRKEFEMGISAVSKARGGPVAPFFRFPFLNESRTVIEHARSRNVGVFFVDVDSKDYTTRDPNSVHRRVMNQLAVTKKGIILFHDIQPSTAKGLKGLLDDLHAKGFKVVHMVPKSAGDTVAKFDTEAGKEIDQKTEAAAAKPLADRSVVWTMAPPPAGAAKAGTMNEAKEKVAVPTAATVDAAPPTEPPEVLPWLQKDQKKAVEPPPKPKRTARPKSDDKAWQFNIFQY